MKPGDLVAVFWDTMADYPIGVIKEVHRFDHDVIAGYTVYVISYSKFTYALPCDLKLLEDIK